MARASVKPLLDRHRLQRRSLSSALALLPWWLTGCATPPPESERGAWTTGRLSVRVAASAGEELRQLSAGFELRGNGDRGELRLNSPLGTQMATARWAPGQAVLTSSRGETWFADLDDLSREALGEVLPLRALPDWLAGRPWPGAPSEAGAEGFEQLGWRVVLTRWTDGWVDAVRDASPSVTVKVRLDPR